MRVAIVEDEPLARSGIIQRLVQYAEISVVAEFENGLEGLQGIPGIKPDLVFVDVEMPNMNGLDMLAALPVGERPMAILLTAHEDFALRAFELNALDYLLKPIKDDRFDEAVERARRTMCAMRAIPSRLHSRQVPAPAQEHVETFAVRVGTRIVLVAAEQIAWVGAEGDYASLHAGDKQYLLRETIQRMMEKLDPARFIRIHRSTIVRIDQISEFQYLTNRDALIRLHDGTPLRVSRTYIEALLQALQTRRRCTL